MQRSLGIFRRGEDLLRQVRLDCSIRFCPSHSRHRRAAKTKKADLAEHPQVSNHVGLLANEPPGEPGCSLFSHPTTSAQPISMGAFNFASTPNSQHSNVRGLENARGALLLARV